MGAVYRPAEPANLDQLRARWLFLSHQYLNSGWHLDFLSALQGRSRIPRYIRLQIHQQIRLWDLVRAALGLSGRWRAHRHGTLGIVDGAQPPAGRMEQGRQPPCGHRRRRRNHVLSSSRDRSTLRHRRHRGLAVVDGYPALGRYTLCSGGSVGVYRHLAGRVRGGPGGRALAHDRPGPHRAGHRLAGGRCRWCLQPLLCLHLVGRHPHIPAGHGRQWLEADPKHGPPQPASRLLGGGGGQLHRRGGLLLDGLPPRLQVRGYQPRWLALSRWPIDHLRRGAR